MIVKRKEGYHVVSEKSGKNLGGPYKTREEAAKRLRAIEYFKHLHGAAKLILVGGMLYAFACGCNQPERLSARDIEVEHRLTVLELRAGLQEAATQYLAQTVQGCIPVPKALVP